MKKIILLIILNIISLNAIAKRFELIEPPQLEITRNYFNFDYTELHGRTLQVNDAEAYFEGGLRYYYGYSKRLDVPYPKDYTAAAKWFYKAGMLNHKNAAYFLGQMYLKGQGVEVSAKNAYWWLEKASELGLKQATLQLGTLYHFAYNNTNLDYSNRQLFLKKSRNNLLSLIKNNNYPYAEHNLAVINLTLDPKDRFVKADANKMLSNAFYGFLKLEDKENMVKTLQVMSYYNLDDYVPNKKVLENYLK